AHDILHLTWVEAENECYDHDQNATTTHGQARLGAYPATILDILAFFPILPFHIVLPHEVGCSFSDTTA
ncbi:MAG TPA: hypothetical protein PLX97_16010, partial [Gemmatales bacterium]|nr:hypothetical protein [Gemmatales bacterium]